MLSSLSYSTGSVAIALASHQYSPMYVKWYVTRVGRFSKVSLDSERQETPQSMTAREISDKLY